MSALHLFVRPDSVAILTFDQPESRANILTTDLWSELEANLDSLANRPEVRGLVLASAKPGVFIAGADLKLLANANAPNDPAVRAFIELGLRVLNKLEAIPFPTCAAIDGAALGGGFEVALACDLQLCSTHEKVRIGLPEVTLGLIPGWGGTQRLPRLVGLATATWMLTTGRSIAAGEAADLGIVIPVESPAPLIEAAAERVLNAANAEAIRQRKRMPVPSAARADFRPTPDLTGAAAEAERVMLAGVAIPLESAIPIETAAFLQLAGGEDSRQRIAEFFASRKK